MGKIQSQNLDLEKKNPIHFGTSLSVLRSSFNNNKEFPSYRAEIFAEMDLLKNEKLNFSFGLGYSNRVLAKGIVNPFDYDDVSSFSKFNYTLIHRYIELPLGLNYKFVNTKRKCEPVIGLVLSPVYLVGGKVSYTTPAIGDFLGGIIIDEEFTEENYSSNKIKNADFFPTLNLNVGLSMGVKINHHFYIGLEGGYFVKDIGSPINCGGDGGSCSRRLYVSTLGLTTKITL